MRKDIDVCFANRDALCHFHILDEDSQEEVRQHFNQCKDCMEWAAKRKMKGRLKNDIRYYCGKAKVLVLHSHKRKAQIEFLEEHDQIFGLNKVNRVRHFNSGETAVTMTRLLWHKHREI